MHCWIGCLARYALLTAIPITPTLNGTPDTQHAVCDDAPLLPASGERHTARRCRAREEDAGAAAPLGQRGVSGQHHGFARADASLCR